MNIDFIQIGANVGNTENDPVYEKVIKLGWGGILIEPNPKAFNQLLLNYKSCNNLFFENIAIGDTIGDITFFVDNYHIDNNGKGEGTSQHASCSQHIIVNKLEHKPEEITAIKCPVTTLTNLWLKYNITGAVQWLFVDTEGFDSKILLSTDFNIVKVKNIQYEWVHITQDEINKVDTHLKNAGYKFVSQQGEDIIYTNE